MLHQNAKLFLNGEEICDCTTTKITPLRFNAKEENQGFLLSIDCLTDNSDKTLVSGEDMVLKVLEDNSEYRISLKVVYEPANQVTTPILAMTYDTVEFNKRKNRRFATNFSGYIEVNDIVYPAIISDLSENGLAIITIRNVNQGQKIMVNLLDDGSQISRFRGIVRRKNFSNGLNPKVYQYGVELSELFDEEREILNDIMDMIDN